jgi:predicted ribosome quality control (RQC) complex YloA/Tae2 family protein
LNILYNDNNVRVANIYDVSGKLYLLKLSKANRKAMLLIESGIRIHTTNFVRNKKDVPSGFSMKVLDNNFLYLYVYK